MRLSEAIRLGAMMKPQGFGEMSAYAHQQDATCAWGAAAEAAGISVRPVIMQSNIAGLRAHAIEPGTLVMMLDIPNEWIEVGNKTAPCPECSTRRYVGQIMAHLNDEHHWTREQIADWVESVEAAQSPEARESGCVQAEEPSPMGKA